MQDMLGDRWCCWHGEGWLLIWVESISWVSI